MEATKKPETIQEIVDYLKEFKSKIVIDTKTLSREQILSYETQGVLASGLISYIETGDFGGGVKEYFLKRLLEIEANRN